MHCTFPQTLIQKHLGPSMKHSKRYSVSRFTLCCHFLHTFHLHIPCTSPAHTLPTRTHHLPHALNHTSHMHSPPPTCAHDLPHVLTYTSHMHTSHMRSHTHTPPTCTHHLPHALTHTHLPHLPHAHLPHLPHTHLTPSRLYRRTRQWTFPVWSWKRQTSRWAKWQRECWQYQAPSEPTSTHTAH